MNILINALGIVDSGGVRVFQSTLSACSKDTSHAYFIIGSQTEFVAELKNKYFHFGHINFFLVSYNSYYYRLYFENFKFRDLIEKFSIDVVYNLSGSAILFTYQIPPQVVKLQNLLFFCKKLDRLYIQERKFKLWFFQIFLKRQMLKLMYRNVLTYEIQSKHVMKYVADFIPIRDRVFLVKSDIDTSSRMFSAPKKYTKFDKVKFLYIVGPHFESVHKNLSDFVKAMLLLQRMDMDFEIHVTLESEQLNNSLIWDPLLNSKTVFHGYVREEECMRKLFCDNTILISTSVIETIGLHVIEAIQEGVVSIVPDEYYAHEVYGSNIVKYKLHDEMSLVGAIMDIVDSGDFSINTVIEAQNYLLESEGRKIKNFLDIFKEVK